MNQIAPEHDEDRAYLAAALTAYALGLRTECILSTERGRPVHARARQIAMYLVYTGLGISLARVGRAFGRDRSTAAHACRAIEEARDDPDFDQWIEQLMAGLVSVARLSTGAAAI